MSPGAGRRSKLAAEPTVVSSDDDDENGKNATASAILISSDDDHDHDDGGRGAAPAELVLASSDDDDTPAASASDRGLPLARSSARSGLVGPQVSVHGAAGRVVRPARPHIVFPSSNKYPRFRCPACRTTFVAWGGCVKHWTSLDTACTDNTDSPAGRSVPRSPQLNADGYECACGERFTGWGDCRTHQQRSRHDCGPAEGQQQRCSLSLQAVQAPFMVTPWPPPSAATLSKHQRRRNNGAEMAEWAEAERAADAADAAEAERVAADADAADAVFFYDTQGNPSASPDDNNSCNDDDAASGSKKKEKKKKKKKKKKKSEEKKRWTKLEKKAAKEEKEKVRKAKQDRGRTAEDATMSSPPLAPSAAAHHPTCECKFACPTCFVGFSKWQGKSGLCLHAKETGHFLEKLSIETCLALGCLDRKRTEKESRTRHHKATGAAASGNGVPRSENHYMCPDCHASFGAWTVCLRHCKQSRHAGWPRQKGMRKRCRPTDIVAAAASATPKFKCPDCGLMYHKFAGIADHAKASNHAGWDGGAGYEGLMERCNAAKLDARKSKRRPDSRRTSAPAAPAAPITSGIGHKLLKMMGWKDGDGLGKKSEGRVEPVSATISSQGSRDKRGLGQAGVGGGGSKRKRGRDSRDGHDGHARQGFKPASTKIQGFALGAPVPGDVPTAACATAAPDRKSKAFVPRQVAGVASRRPNPIGPRGSRGAGYAGQPPVQSHPEHLPPPPPSCPPSHDQPRGRQGFGRRGFGPQQQQPGSWEGGGDRMYDSYR